MPFQNDVGKITINGSEIWNAFEYSVRRYSTTVGNGEFIQVSGKWLKSMKKKKNIAFIFILYFITR